MHVKLPKWTPYLLLVPAVLLAVQAAFINQRSRGALAPDVPSAVSAATTPDPSPAPFDSFDTAAWAVFRASGEVATGEGHPRYRLAGTFFMMGQEGATTRQRLAIIDDLSDSRQYIVNEGSTFQEYDVVRIYQDRLILRKDGNETVLDLSFAGGTAGVGLATGKVSTDAEGGDSGSTRFGRQVGERRWVMQRDALVAYYRELLDDPERIAAIYMSMKPDYAEDGKVSGYRLEKEGEAEFFDSVGLREGDVIRKVNSMRMTSQKRAEYLISEFMQDRMGAVVLDIERDGREDKLIYLMR